MSFIFGVASLLQFYYLVCIHSLLRSLYIIYMCMRLLLNDRRDPVLIRGNFIGGIVQNSQATDADVIEENMNSSFRFHIYEKRKNSVVGMMQ